ncbi:uncharacterized protein RB166_016801 [Leptodactylus fuscus]
MERLPRLRALGCRVCGDPVSPCPSPACSPELFSELAPVVYRSVLLSFSYPQLTRQELESKLRTGKIERFQTYPLKNQPKSQEDQLDYGDHKQFSALTVVPQHPSLQKTSPGYFSNLRHLQRQLVSGHSRWKRPIGQQGKEKSPKMLPAAKCEMARNTKISNAATYGLFPPILDVWAQRDAMHRSITLRI